MKMKTGREMPGLHLGRLRRMSKDAEQDSDRSGNPTADTPKPALRGQNRIHEST